MIRRAAFYVYLFSLALVMMSSCSREKATSRVRQDFNKNWRFELKDSSLFSRIGFDDSGWRILDLPHDWSIEGEFSIDNPAGAGCGALPTGTGWYRKTFSVPVTDSSKKIYITFDGIYHNSEVYLNGHLFGVRPNGYIGFQYDLSPYLVFGDTTNVIAVRVDNSDQPNSRWYSGSGIYRNVWLEKMDPVHVDHWGTLVTTRILPEDSAEIRYSVAITNTTDKEKRLLLETRILDNDRVVWASRTDSVTVSSEDSQKLEQTFRIVNPQLWDTEDPRLYRAVTFLSSDHEVIDVYETPFGIRTFRFDPEKGFFLNGRPVKICGVCNHHYLGALGAAVSPRAIERQLEILKDMGCNAIRTSHNPPAPELLELCDRMGFLVMDETFDSWAKNKVEYDYSRDWAEWHTRDLTDHLLRDRNHPCIFAWSIGNEILEQWDSTGTIIAGELATIVRELAPGMLITSGLNNPVPGNYLVRSGELDLIGFNYHHQAFEQFPEDFPGQVFIGTETNSSLSTRGVYDMPSDSIRIWPVRWDLPFTGGNPDNTCSSYDNCRTPWGSTHEETWELVKKHDYLSGMFIWTGFDYLGEPTPYGWPSRSSYYGLVDLAGFPKDAYYFYQSEWTSKPVLHLFPHWNWKEGESVDVWAYTNYDEVELFVNGKSQGVRYKNDEDLHFQWRVTYEPGTIMAVGKNKNGETEEVTIRTAGAASKIELVADRTTILADGTDLAFITVNILDKDGYPVPRADNMIHFDVPDMLEIAGVDNGNQTSHEPFKVNYRKAFNGKCLLIVRSGGKTGKAVINASSEGLIPADIILTLE